MRISTEGSSFDTVLAVYTGASSAYVDLVEMACDDNGGADGKSSVLLFPTVEGQIYYIAMDGLDGAKGLVKFKYEVAAPPFVGDAPTWGKIDPVTEQPLGGGIDPTVQVGDSLRFTVRADNVLAPVDLTYQWRHDSLDITGATSGSLILKNITERDSGEYLVVAGNFSGSVTSAPVRLDFTAPVTLLAGLEDVAVDAGESATFGVVVDGSEPFEYQWTFNGELVTGATGSTLTLENVGGDGGWSLCGERDQCSGDDPQSGESRRVSGTCHCQTATCADGGCGWDCAIPCVGNRDRSAELPVATEWGHS